MGYDDNRIGFEISSSAESYIPPIGECRICKVCLTSMLIAARFFSRATSHEVVCGGDCRKSIRQLLACWLRRCCRSSS